MYVRKHQRARKSYRCWLCDRTIGAGEVYMRGVELGGGTARTWIECGHCDLVVAVVLHQIKEDEYGDDTVNEWWPETVSEARVRAQWKRRWTSRSGALYPLPEHIMSTAYGFSWAVSIRPGEL